jgi:putative transposase
MVMYRRNFVPGGTYFFTLAMADRGSTMLIDHVDELREAYRSVVATRAITTVAICILPNHLHSIWTMPDGDANYSSAWALIKARFSRSIAKNNLHVVRVQDGGFNVWQRRFWEHTIRDERDLENHVNYIHFNPVKHGHVSRAVDWAHSSFHRYVRDGLLAVDWASDSTLNIPDN